MNIQKTIMRDQIGTEGLLDLIREVDNTTDKVMIEIGTFTGESTIIFGDHFKQVVGIDPMLPDYDVKDPTSKFNFNEVLEMFEDRTKDYKNISLIKKTSDNAVKELDGETYDFIYIDGIHTYEQVKKDIQNYLPLVKKGGVIGGHDYVNSGHLIGVYEAVNEILGKPDKTFKDGSWIKFL